MATTQTAQDFLMGGGIPSAKFPSIGSAVTGTIAREPELQQQTDFDTGEPLVWTDGSPRMQAKVVLSTGLRDPLDPHDDGSRAIYVKGPMQKAIAAAVRAAGQQRLEVGGTLTVTYSADGIAQGRKNPPKLFTATYAPPNPVELAADRDEEAPAGIDPTAWRLMNASEREHLRVKLFAAAAAPPY